MEKEELIGKLQMVYVGDRNALNELIGYYDGLKELIQMVQQENTDLKKQLEYLRSGEYLNQLKFERNMLENIVQNMEVSKEDKEFIDMTHRNTELLEENKQLKEKLNLRNKEKTDICNKLVNYREKNKRLKKEITNLISINKSSKSEIQQLKDRITNAIERLEALIIFWKKYNPIDNTMQVEQFKGVISLLKEDNKEKVDE